MPPAGLCFTDVTFFFKCRPYHSKTGQTDYCVNTVDKRIANAKNVVNFGPVTTEILWLKCMGGECT